MEAINLAQENAELRAAVNYLEARINAYVARYGTLKGVETRIQPITLQERDRQWRELTAQVYAYWDADKNMKVGKMLRAMSDPKFAKTYLPETTFLHGEPACASY